MTPSPILQAIVLITLATAATADERVTIRDDLLSHFAAAGTEGTMVIHDRLGQEMIVIGEGRAVQPFSPSSTFKIPNTLIALETGSIVGMDEVFPFSGQPFLVNDQPFLPDACNADVTVATALRYSCIPVYQNIARRIGADTYNRWLGDSGYGPAIVTEANLTDFWLNGDLALTAFDQIAFLDRLTSGELGVDDARLRAVAEVLAVDQPGDAAVYAKTGYVFSTDPAIGWYVGWVESDARLITFALNLDIATPDHAKARQAVAFAVLRDLGLIGTVQ
ncbi:penicillin-binding transpeptidase domain-containing protein [Tabrizicola sp.]|uniref:penicillin-binding transpeptidase domain-containing protein n=1 Tax=Tabrizicola sp. TaxID=2005166 RepID=UPI003F314844